MEKNEPEIVEQKKKYDKPLVLEFDIESITDGGLCACCTSSFRH